MKSDDADVDLEFSAGDIGAVDGASPPKDWWETFGGDREALMRELKARVDAYQADKEERARQRLLRREPSQQATKATVKLSQQPGVAADGQSLAGSGAVSEAHNPRETVGTIAPLEHQTDERAIPATKDDETHSPGGAPLVPAAPPSWPTGTPDLSGHPSADLLQLLAEMRATVSSDPGSYWKVEDRLVQVNKELSCRGVIPPAFRPTIRLMSVNKADRRSLHRDQQVIDAHWCWTRRYEARSELARRAVGGDFDQDAALRFATEKHQMPAKARALAGC